MRFKINFFFLFLPAFVLMSCSNELSNVSISKTFVDGYSSELPLIDNTTPRFSWQMISDVNGSSQSAYQILVNEITASGEDEVWNSGKVKSSQSILIPYEGSPLESDCRYSWRVKVWDEDGDTSKLSEKARFQMGLLSDTDWKSAKWIGYKQLPAGKKLSLGVTGYGELSHGKVEERAVVPMFRKSFDISKQIESATLFITGLGQYEATVNGNKITDAVFTPSWSNYDEVVYYNSYDVTKSVSGGENVIGVIVGNGFHYNNRERYRKLIIAFGLPRMICKLQIRYTDGSIENIISDDSWKTKPSAITYSGIYGGEDYDARLEDEGWDNKGFDDKSWEQSLLVDAPSGELKTDINNPIKVMKIFKPMKTTIINDSTVVYDFGQNASANIGMTLRGSEGKEVRFYPGESLKESGGISQRGTGSPYYYSYRLKGDGDESWKARFAYYGFRYAEARGVNANGNCHGLPSVVSVESRHIRNSASQLGTFTSSNELLNKTFDLINWGIKSNMQSVMTDCPTREKLGWIEQTQLMGTSIHYNFDLYHLYKKLLCDMVGAQTADGLVPNIVPEYINFEYYDAAFRDSPEWGSASIILPWMIHKWYGDKEPMRNSWDMMNRYMNYLSSKASDNILSHGLGDWYDIGSNAPGYAQLTSVDLVATATYFYDAKLMAEMAESMDDEQRKAHYTKLAEDIRKNFNAKYYNAETATYGSGSQTALAMPLSMGIVEKKNEKNLLLSLVTQIEKDGKSVTAGDVGFHFLVDALTKFGKSELLYEMNNRDDVPGYGYQLKQGATALAESWQSLTNKSMNHLMLGHLMEWFYKGLGGISQTEESYAYKHLLIAPEVVADISNVDASFNSPYGIVKSEWTQTGTDFTLKVSIPVNSDALIRLPFDKEVVITDSKGDVIDSTKTAGGYLLPSGSYQLKQQR